MPWSIEVFGSRHLDRGRSRPIAGCRVEPWKAPAISPQRCQGIGLLCAKLTKGLSEARDARDARRRRCAGQHTESLMRPRQAFNNIRQLFSVTRMRCCACLCAKWWDCAGDRFTFAWSWISESDSKSDFESDFDFEFQPRFLRTSQLRESAMKTAMRCAS